LLDASLAPSSPRVAFATRGGIIRILTVFVNRFCEFFCRR